MITGTNSFYHLDDLSKPTLVSNTDPNKEYFVFCFKDKITCVKAKFKAETIAKSIEVILDDQSSVKVGLNQEFLMRDYTILKLTDLKFNDRLSPFYTRKRVNSLQYYEISDYFKESLRDSDKNRYRNISRLVAEYKLNRRLNFNERVAMADKNQNNCNLENIIITMVGERTREYPYVKAVEEAIRVLKLLKNHRILEIKQEETDTLFSVKCAEKVPVAISGIFLMSD